MHGMLSAAILILLFAGVVVACLYAAAVVYAAGRQPRQERDSSDPRG
jgi:hypothetical protein